MAQGEKGSTGFWSSLPGVLTGLAALLTACVGLYAVARGPTTPTSPPSSAQNIAAQALPVTPAQPARGAEPNVAPAPIIAPGQCVAGYVWREARPGDKVCVTPATRDYTAAENAAADSRRAPGGGAYGPDTCLSGFVWREAFEGDTVCVTPESRQRAKDDNQAAADRVVRS